MSLLREIQEAIVEQSAELGPILLKLRLLADRLGSHELEEWVKYESEGYPADVDVPEYRQIEIAYTGNFHNVAWKISNQPIPSYLIEKHCGKSWTTYRVRESIAAIDEMTKKTQNGGKLGIDASNLILMLQGKIYQGMNCTSVEATFSEVALGEIRNAVRTRILELTMSLEKQVPGASEVSISKPLKSDSGAADKIEQVFHTTVYGTNQMVANTGSNANISLNNASGDINGLINELIESGIPKEHAIEFSDLLSSEQPLKDQPFGKRTLDWLCKKLPEIAKGTWGIATSVATAILEEAAKKYYGLN